MLGKTKKLLVFWSEENKTFLKKTVILLRCVDEKLATMCIKLLQCSQGRQAPVCRRANILFLRAGKRSFLFFLLVCFACFWLSEKNNKEKLSSKHTKKCDQ